MNYVPVCDMPGVHGMELLISASCTQLALKLHVLMAITNHSWLHALPENEVNVIVLQLFVSVGDAFETLVAQLHN